MKKRISSVYATIIVFSDICAYYVALVLAYCVRTLLNDIFAIPELAFSIWHFVSFGWILVLVLFSTSVNGLYRRRDPIWAEAGRIFKALTFAFMATFAIVSLGRMSAEVSRLFIVLLWIFSTFIFIIFRLIAKRILFKISYFQEKMLLIGDKSRLDAIAKAFNDEWFMGIKVAIRLSVSPLPTPKRINRTIESMGISGAIIVPSPKDTLKTEALFSHIHTKVLRMIYVPEMGATSFTNAETGQLLGSQLGYLSIGNALQSFANQALKRAFDMVLFVLLAPLVLPVILVLMLVVRLTSPGAAIFTHERVGRNGKPFKIYKLRTMYKNAQERLKQMIAEDPAVKAEWEANHKLKNDPRVTPIGNFLRKTSLDELPQFFNVFRGNMSFVGPRPVIKRELENYYKDNAAYYCMAIPGITGLWQVRGRNDTSYDERVNMDCWYVFNWSIWLDIVLLFSTPMAVIMRRGAY